MILRRKNAPEYRKEESKLHKACSLLVLVPGQCLAHVDSHYKNVLADSHVSLVSLFVIQPCFIQAGSDIVKVVYALLTNYVISMRNRKVAFVLCISNLTLYER